MKWRKEKLLEMDNSIKVQYFETSEDIKKKYSGVALENFVNSHKINLFRTTLHSLQIHTIMADSVLK